MFVYTTNFVHKVDAFLTLIFSKTHSCVKNISVKNGMKKCVKKFVLKMFKIVC